MFKLNSSSVKRDSFRRNSATNLLQSGPLYHACSSLRSRLVLIEGFDLLFELIASGQYDSEPESVSPVNQLWALFSFGIPLCYLFNLLGKDTHIDIECRPEDLYAQDEYTKKLAISLFALHTRRYFPERGLQPFTFSELLDRRSSRGLEKVCIRDVVHPESNVHCRIGD